jgi:adenylosuccinate lyase
MTVELVQAKAESDALERSTERSVSALDGRYRDLTSELGDHVSEWALIKHRTRVEVEWLIRLSDLPEIAELRALSDDERSFLRDLVCCFDDEDARAVKRWEKITNHDVKAVEYYLRDRMASAGLEDVVEFVHFASTSEDVNNLAHGLMLKGAVAEAWRPAASALVDAVATIAFETRDTAILSQTHGQPASPSTFGKEMAVFVHRWRKQLAALDRIEYLGKSNGAVGTYGAHLIAYPTVDWEAVARAHVEALGLTWSPLTTQIESHDWIAELFHVIGRFNAILLDFDRDIWLYISRRCLRQRAIDGEVGSSTMPHKINPINFENSEANAGVSIALGNHMASTLTVSRLQRDLSDSSLMRNLGAVVGHSLIALKTARRGLSRVEVDETVCAEELAGRWELLGEAIQTILRKRGVPDPYEVLKSISRGRLLTRDALVEFLESADLDPADRRRLCELTPGAYTGMASELVEHIRER